MMALMHLKGKGRATVAVSDIEKGKVIERAPIASFPAEQRPTVNCTTIFEHYFVKPLEYENSNHIPGYIVFGLSSICNHAIEPNAEILWEQDQIGEWACLKAKKNIKQGEEITISYTNIDEYANADEFIYN